MPEINGKQVIFRQHFPAKDNWDLPQRLMALASQAESGSLDLELAVPVLQRMILSWEFDSDPTETESYGELDIFRELIPMITQAAQFIGELTGAGEQVSGST